MIDFEREIGSDLVRARSKSRKKTKEIATQLKIGLSNIGHWESGDCLPPIHKSNEIAQAYGLDEKDFTQKLQKAWGVREQQKLISKSLRKKTPNCSSEAVSGGIGKTHDIIRANFYFTRGKD